jgi:acetyl-CoA acetyltransferase
LNPVFNCDCIHSPIERCGGASSSLRTDDMGGVSMRAPAARNRGVDWNTVDDVMYGCANQAG